MRRRKERCCLIGRLGHVVLPSQLGGDWLISRRLRNKTDQVSTGMPMDGVQERLRRILIEIRGMALHDAVKLSLTCCRQLEQCGWCLSQFARPA
jgi:hypothetical protein